MNMYACSRSPAPSVSQHRRASLLVFMLFCLSFMFRDNTFIGCLLQRIIEDNVILFFNKPPRAVHFSIRAAQR